MQRAWPVLRDYLLITIGAVLVAASVNMFLTPNRVVMGGLTGGAQLLNTFLGTPIGLVTLIANIPLFVIGFRSLGGFVFGVRTIYATVVMSLAIDLLAPYMRPVTADPLLYTLYGGLLDGLGVGLVFRARGTTGGVDIIARLLERRFALRPGRSILAMNLVVFGLALFAYGPENVLYALLVAFIGSVALDYVLAAGSGARQAFIITTQPEPITQALLHDLGRGVTLIEGQGGYTGARRAVLLCVVARSEISFLNALVSRVDPHAFVVIGEAQEVVGEGFVQRG
ncbi:MAG TPA: YitT family protein [Kouleothrix sp.]|uniref:YitT family protein n=1 Tax=Kouleothrix sp. TaxID=2779161 RepID=UPI002B698361|nr:YitT family protein [Kouleothrix sp.]HRC74238.1 YitT family protein [Kouleothrix sp.]